MVGEPADAGASRPTTTRADTTATAATRSARNRLKRATTPSSLLAERYSPIRPAVGNGSGRSLLVLPQHPDQHRPKGAILLAVDQELGGQTPPCLYDGETVLGHREERGATPLR